MKLQVMMNLRTWVKSMKPITPDKRRLPRTDTQKPMNFQLIHSFCKKYITNLNLSISIHDINNMLLKNKHGIKKVAQRVQ